MSKFISIPVTSQTNQLVSADGVLLVEQASTTTVTLAYAGGKVTTITHATQASGVAMRDQIQAAIVKIHQQNWQNTTISIVPLYAVSGIAVA